MVRDLEAARVQQRVDFAIDQLFELRTRVEVGDDTAVGAHEVMVMMLRKLLGQFVTIATADARDPDHNTGLDQFGEISIRGRRRYASAGHNLFNGQRARRVLQHGEYRTSVAC